MTQSDLALPTVPSPSRLLLVEDEENLGSTLLEWLSGRGYEVHWARSVQEALTQATALRIHLGILDVGLPDGSGFDLARRLLQNPATTFPFLFLTAYGTPEDRVQGLEIGAQDYMIKPFHLRELELRIAAILARSATLATLDLFPDIRFSYQALEITNSYGSHKLTLKEAALLQVLVEHRGHVVSRDRILDRVWGTEANPTPRTVDNFILKLRKLIEPNPENPQRLLSHRGIGYQLVRSS